MNQVLAVVAFTLLPASSPAEAPTVGLPARIDGLVLPGPELEAKPLTERTTPVVVRIVNVWPHGDAFRYDVEYYGLAPGRYDLRDYLRRKDGSSLIAVPAIPVEIRGVLSAGQVTPHDLEAGPGPRVGGYRVAATIGGLLWVVGLLAIVFVGRRRARAQAEARRGPETLAEHLKPLVEGAVAGRLSPDGLAELERTLLIYWERRLDLRGQRPVDMIARLRQHPEAGPLLRGLEDWLHRPQVGTLVDVATLLRPYENAPAQPGEVPA